MKKFALIVFMALACFSCSDKDDLAIDDIPQPKDYSIGPSLESLTFLSNDNPRQMVLDAQAEITDSIVTVWIRNIMQSKNLVPRFTIDGDSLFFDGRVAESGLSEVDFSKPVELEVRKSGKQKTYTVYVHSYTGLPIIWVDTEDRQEIKSKEEYLNATFKLTQDIITRSAGETIVKDVLVKGRGNYTWTYYPKKPYRLKFHEKVSLLDEAKDKSWVLLANYRDKAMLNNMTSFYLGSISKLEYTPKSHFVEFMLNGVYQGTYQLTEKLKIGKHRARLGGVLLEVDRYAPTEADSRYFSVDSIKFPINIKDPDVEYGDSVYEYSKSFVQNAEKVLFSDYFKDPERGWRKYLDMESFADWYIITEIAKTPESIWLTSYMTLKEGEQLKMGPLWDYDFGYGNYYSKSFPDIESPEGFYLKNNAWYSRLFEDEYFVSCVKTRMAFFYNNLDNVLREINENANYLKYSVQENNSKWGILYVPDKYRNTDNYIWGSYENEVQRLKTWIIDRMTWLNTNIESL